MDVSLDIQILSPSEHLTEGFKTLKYSLIIFLIAALLNFFSGITSTNSGLSCLYQFFFIIWIFFVYKSLKELSKASPYIKSKNYELNIYRSKVFLVLSIFMLIIGVALIYVGIDALASSVAENTNSNREALVSLLQGLEPILISTILLSGILNIFFGLIYYFSLKTFKNYSMVKIGMLTVVIISILMIIVDIYLSHILIADAIANIPNTDNLTELENYFKSVIANTNLVYISNLIYLGSIVGLLFYLKAESDIEKGIYLSTIRP